MEKDLTIRPEATIKEAMKALSRTAESILLVVDEGKRLIGTLTDGDIRRYILKGHDLQGTIVEAFNPKSIYVYQKDLNNEQIKKTLIQKKIVLIPVVNEKLGIVDYITWEKAFGNSIKRPKKKLDIPVVIMAGGRGTRLEPFTKILPKPLMPIHDKPIIDHIIDSFREYGVRDFYVTINYKSRILKAYFEENQQNSSIKFIEETTELGTAGSLKYLSGKVEKPLFVKNCDILIKADYGDIFDFHEKGEYGVTLVASVKHYNIPYGVCELNGAGHLDYIREKPEYSFMVNTGLYLINPTILKLIPDGKLFHMTQLIEKAKEEGEKIGVYPISEDAWIDIGQWAEYKKLISEIEGFSPPL